MKTLFQPTQQPALRFYLALSDESTHRHSRGVGQWITAERTRMLTEAQNYARENGFELPDLKDIERAESNASGHVDYMAKFAYGVADFFNRQRNPRRSERSNG